MADHVDMLGVCDLCEGRRIIYARVAATVVFQDLLDQQFSRLYQLCADCCDNIGLTKDKVQASDERLKPSEPRPVFRSVINRPALPPCASCGATAVALTSNGYLCAKCASM